MNNRSRTYGNRNYTMTRIDSLTQRVKNRIKAIAKASPTKTVTADDVEHALTTFKIGRNELEFRVGIINRVFQKPDFVPTGYTVPSERPVAKHRRIMEWRSATA